MEHILNTAPLVGLACIGIAGIIFSVKALAPRVSESYHRTHHVWEPLGIGFLLLGLLLMAAWMIPVPEPGYTLK